MENERGHTKEAHQAREGTQTPSFDFDYSSIEKPPLLRAYDELNRYLSQIVIHETLLVPNPAQDPDLYNLIETEPPPIIPQGNRFIPNPHYRFELRLHYEKRSDLASRAKERNRHAIIISSFRDSLLLPLGVMILHSGADNTELPLAIERMLDLLNGETNPLTSKQTAHCRQLIAQLTSV